MNQKLLLIALSGLSLTALADEARLLRFPATNGKEIVFSYAGDLYQVPMSGGEAQRLTSHVGYEMFPRFSPDGKTMYIKGIKNNITAADVSKGNYTPLWNTLMPYEGNFIPTRMETTEEYVFIPTEFGVVHAVRTDGSGIAWSHKVSHSAVTSLKKAGDHRLIVMTMDGTVTCLIYP